jgi:transposase InsO family protein
VTDVTYICTAEGRLYLAATLDLFFAALKGEVVDHARCATWAAAVASIGDYIERFYNAERRHSHLGCLSPIEFELRSKAVVTAAWCDRPPGRINCSIGEGARCFRLP